MQNKQIKKCSKCKDVKSIDDFNIKNGNKKQSFCRECQSQYHKEYYEKNKEKYRAKNQRLRIQSKRRYYQWLLKQSCVDCGETDPILLDADHVGVKTSSLCRLVNSFASWDRIKKELKQCQIRCVSCHRKKTAKDFGWYKWLNIRD